MKNIVVVSFVIISAFKTGHGQTMNCGTPPQPRNGDWKVHKSQCQSGEHCHVGQDFQFQIGTRLVYSCNIGFKIKDITPVFCGRNGVWNNIPECEEVHCPNPNSASVVADCSNPATNSTSCDSPKPGTTATLKCRKSYREDRTLSSPRNVRCNDIGEWTPQLLRCNSRPPLIPLTSVLGTNYGSSVTCRTPPQPRNGDWKVHKSQCQSGEHCHVGQDIRLPMATHLVYSCNSGFKIKGFTDVFCGINSLWNNIPGCEEVHCPNPNSASVVADCSNPSTDSTSCDSPEPGTIAILKCRDSYRLDRTLPTPTNVTCNDIGEWTPQPLRCVPEPSVIPLTTTTVTPYVPSVTCRSPPQPRNGDWKVHKSQCQSGEHCHAGQDFHFQIGTHLVYSCNRGFKIKGFTDVLCAINGVWYNIPECEEVHCLNPNSASVVADCSNPSTVSTSCDSPEPGTIAILKCRDSYRLDRTLPTPTNVTCNDIGEWTPQLLRCNSRLPLIPLTPVLGTTYGSSVTCRTPPQPRNGDWKVHKSQCQSGEHCHAGQDFHFQIGTHLVYSCNSGFKIKGFTDVLCAIDGVWYNIPECEEVRCTNLNSASIVADCKYPGPDFISCDSPKPGTIATLKCRNSYREDRTLPSPTNVRCNDNGEWTPQPLRCVPVCGIIPTATTPLIVNGTLANYTEFPWHATLYRAVTPTAPKEFICGGTIIHETLIITAAHCIYDESNRRKHDASKFFVATGIQYKDYDSPYHNNVTLVRTAVKKIYVSCDYNGIFGNYKADIAILEVATPFVFSTLLQPICLDYSNNVILEPGVIGRVAGFGRTAWGPSSYILLTIKVPYISKRKCKEESNIHETENYITYDKFCAGYENGSSVCDGDSGGGLIFEWGKLWYLKGIVSGSVGTKVVGGSRQCDSYTYSFYTDVSFHMKWIEDFILVVDDIQRFHTSC